MYLTEMFPELLNRTIWANMTLTHIVMNVISSEQEFGRPLPNNSFYKSIAIKLVKESQKRFKAL